MKKIILGISIVLIVVVSFVVIQYFTINDKALILREEIIGEKAKVEASMDNMKKTINQISQVVSSEKEAFIEFQSLVATSKKEQDIGAIMSSINEKYPDFEIKDDYKKLISNIEIKRNEFLSAQNTYNMKVVNYNQFIVKLSNKLFLDDMFEKFEPFVVSSSYTKKSMQTGIDDDNDLGL